MSEDTASNVVPLRASDVAYDQLREIILDSSLAPGEVINELSLSSMIGIGVTGIDGQRAPSRCGGLAAFAQPEILAEFLHFSLTSGRHMLSHRELLIAFENRHADAAEAATRAQIEGARQLLVTLFDGN